MRFSRIVLLILLLMGPGALLVAEGNSGKKSPEDRLAEMEDRVYETEDPKKKIKHLLSCASYAKSNDMGDEAERYYNDVLSIDPFHDKAHKQLGHEKLMEVWITADEYKDFKETLEEEKKDEALVMVRKTVFDNNTQIGRKALERFGQISRAWAIDTAYDVMYRTDDVFMEDIATDIFYSWAGDRARDVWIKRISRTRNVGGTLKMLGYLRSSMTGDPDNVATKFVMKELFAKRNENISLKCVEILGELNSEEINAKLRKFMPRCNNMNVKQKIMDLLF